MVYDKNISMPPNNIQIIMSKKPMIFTSWIQKLSRFLNKFLFYKPCFFHKDLCNPWDSMMLPSLGSGSNKVHIILIPIVTDTDKEFIQIQGHQTFQCKRKDLIF